jgi:hypothetical protein
MREFENDDFPYHLAEGIESFNLTVPDSEAENALAYIRQFVYKTSGSSELLHGYVTENYVDALVRIRDASSNRDFNSAVEAIGSDGGTSTDVGSDSDFTLIEVDASFETVNALSAATREQSSELSDVAREELYSIREVVENVSHREVVTYCLPEEAFSEIAPILDENDVFL